MREYRQRYEQFWSQHEELDRFYEYEGHKLLPLLLQTPGRVLDLGSGDGVIGEFLKGNGFDVVSLDFSRQALLKAKGLRKLDKCIQADAQYLPFADEIFDFIVCGDILEHLLYPKKTVKEIYRCLEREGTVIILIPNNSYWRHRVYYILYGMTPNTGILYKEPWEWEHIRFFNRKVIKNLLETSGLEMEKVIGFTHSGKLVGFAEWKKKGSTPWAIRRFLRHLLGLALGRIDNRLARKIDLFAKDLIVEARKNRGQ